MSNDVGGDLSPERAPGDPPVESKSRFSFRPGALQEFKRSWRILCVGLIGFPCCCVPQAAPGLFIEPLSRAFGWSLSAISGQAIFIGLGAVIGGPGIGRLMDRFGPRRVGLIYIPTWAFSVAAGGLLGGGIWSLYVVMFARGCLSAALITFYVRAVGAWFDAGRGTVVGMMFAAGGVMAVIGPEATQWGMDYFGWRRTFMGLALVVVVAWPLTFVWLPSNEAPEKRGESAAVSSGEDYTRKEAMGMLVFWLCACAWSLFGLMSGATFFLVPFLGEKGMSQDAAAWCLAIWGAAGVLSQPICGIINDLWNASFVGAASFLTFGLGLAILALFGGRHAILALVLMGVAGSGLNNSLYSFLPRYFGLKSFGEISGMLGSLAMAVGMVGPLLFSFLRDASGGYTIPYLTTAAISVGAASCWLIAARHPLPKWSAGSKNNPCIHSAKGVA
jgi:predicted MFS family arabinose efflux permease